MDFFFPYECLSCGKEGSLVCDLCKKSLPVSGHSFSVPSLDWCYTFGKYDHAILSKGIKAFKYRYSKEFLKDFRSFFERSFPFGHLSEETVFVPVPLFSIREKERGFNQSTLLAELFSDITQKSYGKSIPILPILSRIRNTPPQATLPQSLRRTNLLDAFQISKNEKPLSPSTFFVLVDDVSTTGSTLRECAKALRKSGYKNIGGLVIAHG